MEIPGFGPIVASSFVAALGDGQAFKCGRVVSAWLGLTPRQHSTGGKPVLLGISKRGNRYLRTMLVHGARAVLRTAEAKDKTDPFSRWAREVAKRRGRHKATLAIANKMARVGLGSAGLKTYTTIHNCCDDLTTPMRGAMASKVAPLLLIKQLSKAAVEKVTEDSQSIGRQE